MKITSSLFGIALLLSICFVACKKNDISQPATPKENQDPIDEKYLAKIEKLGFKRSSVKCYDSVFVVENDIIIAKKFLDTFRIPVVNPNDRHAHSDQSLSFNNIRIYASDAWWSNATYYSALNRAVYEWNAAGSNLNFHILFQTDQGIDWNLIFTSLPGTTLASADFPGVPDLNGVPGYNILVNQNYINALGLTSNQISWILTHEMGHMLGLRHTDWDINGEPNSQDGLWVGGNYFPNITVHDPSSVMMAVFNRNTNNGNVLLSSYDKLAVNTLYPLNCNLQTYINRSSVESSGSASGTLYPSYRGPVSLVEWQITNSATGYNYTSTDSDIEFQVPSLAPGTYVFRTRITTPTCVSSWASKTITIQ
ncbi:M57 family metalloprotease [Chitinophaga filiformis]|uniref:Dual-action HEIGH metallo-peptidase n=1 Tax=Chitinophaga filiformis TaxID=104663 RepID=A0A1G7I178_CHIFI|nr:M57 family metalloprotease [Chitinophaga filiformis]SDF06134.1 Dual-action HEIGH metallo-peptidase [Chitinophaga filiformis]